MIASPRESAIITMITAQTADPVLYLFFHFSGT
ncbi:hypothetical protein ROLI_003550 [Roseobacter fucihabitans]|uniref:Uncharacterized protein n=1 Tax=Roseobacter fucihabitans TaxID=1537242 RepID=A0ABZ2BP10_9RHOB|nr:hypothetical protein [Roseobacter litoralis]